MLRLSQTGCHRQFNTDQDQDQEDLGEKIQDPEGFDWRLPFQQQDDGSQAVEQVCPCQYQEEAG